MPESQVAERSHRGDRRHTDLGSGTEFLSRGNDATGSPSGSDRIAEAAGRCKCDAVVNIQGDEPLIDPKVIDAVAGALASNEMSTAAVRIKNPAELDNPNVVKVVVSAAGRALYFSRRTIPYLRDKVGRASSLSSERAGASGKKDFHNKSAQDLGRQEACPTLAPAVR